MKKTISVILCIVIALLPLSLTVYAGGDTPFDDSLFFEYKGYSIHYRIKEHSGDFKGRILMIHGFLCSTYAWRNMAQGMSEEGYDCIMVDLPNFGYSTIETEETTVVAREEIVSELMEKIAPGGEWIIAGHSMGGGVAINIAEKTSAKALLLYCPCPQSEMDNSMKGLMTGKLMTGFMNAFFGVGLRITPLVKLVIWFATFNTKFSFDYDTDKITGPLLRKDAGTGLCNMMFNVLPTDLEKTDSITCPVLICNADKDVILNSSMKESILNAFPDAATYMVEGGGHQCIEDRAEELCSVTADFLG